MDVRTYAHQDAVRFGAVIRRLRTERHWTIIQLAQRCAMNPNYLGHLEKGGNMPSLAASSRSPASSTSPPPRSLREVEEAGKQER